MFRLARLLVVFLSFGLALGVVAAVPAQAASPVPRTPAGLPSAIEPLAPYQEQTACDPKTRPGTAALARLLVATYRGTTYGTTRPCGVGESSRSEHYDGRAIDWMVDIHNKSQLAAGNAFIAWLLATDSAGNRLAMARRLGVMYVIYNNRMWGAWSGRWEEYSGCSRRPQAAEHNACHRTHVHISLDWNGAMGRTTFWTGKISPTDYGPCRHTGLNWAGRYWNANPTPCAWLPTYHAAAGSSALKRALVYYSGAVVHPGASGPAVSYVQQALHVSATGSYNSATRAAIIAFKARQGLASHSGRLKWKAWLALLPTVR